MGSLGVDMFQTPFKKRLDRFIKLFPFTFNKLDTRSLHKWDKSFSAERLSNRMALRVCGDNSSEFLQGLITNDMQMFERGSQSIYTLFLNNKGRVLFDGIIFKTSDKNQFLLDCDSECVEDLIKHLKLYKVRRKIDISPVDSEYSVWAIYNPNLINYDISQEVLDLNYNTGPISCEDNLFVADPRLPALGYRALIKRQDLIDCLPLCSKFKATRYKLGVAEGVEELQMGQSLPLEINCDYLNGVSFDKGCYIGQELTARTFHTGVIRKRLMPLIFEKEPKDVPYNSPIDNPEASKKSPLGKFKGFCGTFGLGLMRVSETLESKSIKMHDIPTKVYVPYWWPYEQRKVVQSNK